MTKAAVFDGYPALPIATAIVMQDNRTVGPLDVETLSSRSLVLRGLCLGSLAHGKAAVILSLPGVGTLRLKAHVFRRDWDQGDCLRAFLSLQGLHPDIEDQIQEAVVRHIERSHLPMVVALDGGRLESLNVKRSLHELGRDVMFAQSSLDALCCLESFRGAYSTILIDYSFIRMAGPEVLLFLHDRYADKRRVLVLPRFEPPRTDLSAMIWTVHGVLSAPWRKEHLESALGLFPAQNAPQPKRILFVDDEPAVLSGLQYRLRKFLGNVETVWVTSGEVALSESRARPFDVVVADLQMPGMDGLTLLHAIKSQAPQSKRIVLTGGESTAAKTIADTVLNKPCPIEVLRNEVLGPA